LRERKLKRIPAHKAKRENGKSTENRKEEGARTPSYGGETNTPPKFRKTF